MWKNNTHTQIDPRHLMTDMSQSFRGPVGTTTTHKQVYQIWLNWCDQLAANQANKLASWST